jgi:hypothetical protein
MAGLLRRGLRDRTALLRHCADHRGAHDIGTYNAASIGSASAVARDRPLWA